MTVATSDPTDVILAPLVGEEPPPPVGGGGSGGGGPGGGGGGGGSGGPGGGGTPTGSYSLGVYIDGVDVSDCALTGSSTRRLNRPSQAQVTLPMDCAIGGAGSRLKIYFNGNLHHHGTVLNCETDAGEDDGQTKYNSTDPMELWAWRPARDYDGLTPGNFIDPYFIKDKVTGPQIVESMLRASENGALIPTAAEGPLFIDYGGFAGGGPDLTGIPTNWPSTIAEIVTLLTSTGVVDVILTPIDSGNMARVDVYNGDYGSNRSGSVVFQYGTGARNVREMRWNEDMSNVTNKLQYFFTPKETVRRYKANITGDDPCLAYSCYDQGTIQSRRMGSRSAYGVRMEIQEFDVAEMAREGLDDDTCDPDTMDPARILYRCLWQQESWIRAIPRTLIHVTPTRGAAIGAFDIGDLVGIEAGSQVRGGFSGAQRVYEYTISWDEDGPFALSELLTSSDAEGA